MGMKRSPMKRSRQPLKAKSAKRRKFYDEVYIPFRRRYLQDHRACEVAVRCDGNTKAQDVHHILSRGRSGRDSDLVDEANVVATCRACHDYIEAHREWALAEGWLKHARRRGE